MPRRTPKATIYELDLLENGLDFVRSGIEIFFSRSTPQPRAHKYAILHVFSGMLLLLKERLARIQPLLVFKNPAAAGKPGAKTIDYHTTICLLEANGVRIDRRAILDEIQGMRNAIEHYRVELPLARSEEIIREMVSFVYSFCRDELDVRINETLSYKALSRFYQLKEVDDRIEKDLDEFAIAEAEAEERYFQESVRRYAAMSPEELLRHSASFHDIPTTEDVPRVRCPSCDESAALVFLETDFGACTNPDCRATYRLDTCKSCYSLMIKGYLSFPLCDSCI